MPANGTRSISPIRSRPVIGDIVLDRTGKKYKVQQLGMRYLLVSIPGGNPKATLMLRTSDVYVSGTGGSMNE